MVRLDIYTPEGRWHAMDELDMTAFRSFPSARSAVLAAVREQGKWDPQAWTLGVADPWHPEHAPVLIPCVPGPEQGNLLEESLRDLVSTLYLYVGLYEWKQLATEQKELFADVVDGGWARSPDMEGSAVERWWRG